MIETTSNHHSGFSEAGLAGIEQMAASYIAAGKSAGMLTLVSRHGKIAQFSCHGHAHIASATAPS